ncbi:MAG: glycosyltransferase [Luteitalea sp.]|nr:glycosyltransferase [Luteitalea sp.]
MMTFAAHRQSRLNLSTSGEAGGVSIEPTAVCIVQPNVAALSETFIQAHADRLPATIHVVHGYPPRVGTQLIASQPLAARAMMKGWRRLTRSPRQREVTADFTRAFRQLRPAVVLAEYGPTGVAVREACQALDIPLVVHFHGFDANQHETLDEHRDSYPILFREAAAIVVVSKHMESRLLSLGADPRTTHLNPYGVDCSLFEGATPASADPILLAVGRFVDKKAPQTTIGAFADAYRGCTAARLRMIGDGPLLAECRELAQALGIAHAVRFLGSQPPDVVRLEMRQVRAFVQHSVAAASGDSEGLPLSILEAGATGLPVVSTRHAGIPDAVIENETGILVDEGDVAAMTAGMRAVLQSPPLAGYLGLNARVRIRHHFSIERSITGLWEILQSSSRRQIGDAALPVLTHLLRGREHRA